MRLGIFIFISIFIINGCTITPLKCTPWVPIIKWESIMNSDINKAIKESSSGTKCESKFY